MSDLQLYELDDISWDEFCHNDDHIVPHPSSGRANEPLSQNDSRKKPRHEVTGLTSNAGDQSTGKYANQQKEQVLSNRSPKMLEKDSWSDAPDGAFSSPREKAIVREASSLPSENTRTSNHCIKSNNIDSTESESRPNGRTLEDKNAAVGENSYSYPLGPISQADDDLSFLDNSCEDKDSNDLLYYSWPEIENFEDVDRMFRNCDSTFGFGPGSEDDLGWLSSSDVIEGSGDGLTSGFKFPCPASSALGSTSASHETSKPKETNISSGTENQSLGYNGSSWSSEKNESVNLSDLSFLNGSSNLECKLVPEKKAEVHGGGVQVEIAANNQPRISNNAKDSMQKKHSKHQNRSEGKRKCGYLENGDALNYTDSLPEEKKLPSGAASTQVNFASAGVLQQKQTHDPDFGYLDGSFSYMHSDYGHSDGNALHPTLPILKYESTGLVSLSPKDSYASNQVQSMEGSPDPSFQVATMTRNENVEKLFHQSGVKVENNRDFEGVGIRMPSELGSSIVQECTSINSAEARRMKKKSNKRTILFIDEVHRFNKAQQDSFLPVIEDGSVIFMGATTENPSFHLITPLLSRCRVLTLNPLKPHHIATLLRRAAADSDKGLSCCMGEMMKIEVNDECIEFLSTNCDGDARVALNALEISATTAAAHTRMARGSNGDNQGNESPLSASISLNDVKEAMQCKHLAYDRAGDEHYNLISALHKSMRGSDAKASIYWLARMLEGGEEPLYIARRLVRFASEDVGLADPLALGQAVACYQACHFIGMPECNVILAQCVAYLALAPKSIAVYRAIGTAQKVVKESVGQNEGVPLHLRNAPTKLMKDLGYGRDYIYPPDNPNSSQTYLPPSLQGYKFLDWPNVSGNDQ